MGRIMDSVVVDLQGQTIVNNNVPMANGTNVEFGEVHFPCSKRTSKYVRIAHDAAENLIKNILFKHWKLKRPKLVISVTGSARDLRVEEAKLRPFRHGITKIVESPGTCSLCVPRKYATGEALITVVSTAALLLADAWVISGGTNVGVMDQVGTAIKECVNPSVMHEVVCLGIVPWGVTKNRDKLLEGVSSTKHR